MRNCGFKRRRAAPKGSGAAPGVRRGASTGTRPRGVARPAVGPGGPQRFRPYLFRFTGLTFSAMSCRPRATRLPAFRPPQRPPTQEGETGSSEEALARDLGPRKKEYGTAVQAKRQKPLKRRGRLFVTATVARADSAGVRQHGPPLTAWRRRRAASRGETGGETFSGRTQDAS